MLVFFNSNQKRETFIDIFLPTFMIFPLYPLYFWCFMLLILAGISKTSNRYHLIISFFRVLYKQIPYAKLKQFCGAVNCIHFDLIEINFLFFFILRKQCIYICIFYAWNLFLCLFLCLYCCMVDLYSSLLLVFWFAKYLL